MCNNIKLCTHAQQTPLPSLPQCASAPHIPWKEIVQQEEPWSVSLRMDPTKKGTIIYFTFQFMFVQGSYNLWKLGKMICHLLGLASLWKRNKSAEVFECLWILTLPVVSYRKASESLNLRIASKTAPNFGCFV